MRALALLAFQTAPRVAFGVMLAALLVATPPPAVAAPPDPFDAELCLDSVAALERGFDGLADHHRGARETGRVDTERMRRQNRIIAAWTDDLLKTWTKLARDPHVTVSACADCRKLLWEARDRLVALRHDCAGLEEILRLGSPFPGTAATAPTTDGMAEGMTFRVDLRESMNGSMTFTEACTVTVDRLGDDVIATTRFEDGAREPWHSTIHLVWEERVVDAVDGLALRVRRKILVAEIEENAEGGPFESLARPGSLYEKGTVLEVLFGPDGPLIREEGHAFLETDWERLDLLGQPLDLAELLPPPRRKGRRWVIEGRRAGDLLGMAAKETARAVLSAEGLRTDRRGAAVLDLEGIFHVPLDGEKDDVVLRGKLAMELAPRLVLPLHLRMEGDSVGTRHLAGTSDEEKDQPYRWKGRWQREISVEPQGMR